MAWIRDVLMRVVWIVVIAMSVSVPAQTGFNERVLNSTFRLTGRGASGTCFVIGKRLSKGGKQHFPLFITASHILKNIYSDSAAIFTRTKDSTGGMCQSPFYIHIKNNGIPLYFIHPSHDIAAFYVKNFSIEKKNLILQSALATDKTFKENEINIGDEMLCLGYPYNFVDNQAGFPILRSGKIASYPLIPASQYQTFLIDFPIFPGNSGGPVYVKAQNQPQGVKGRAGNGEGYIIGVLTEQLHKINSASDLTMSISLQLGRVLHSNVLLEFVSSIPDPDDATVSNCAF